jgi:hypothetical protein
MTMNQVLYVISRCSLFYDSLLRNELGRVTKDLEAASAILELKEKLV